MKIRTQEPPKNATPEMAYTTGDGVGEQWFVYGGKSYHVDDILAVMKAAESGEVKKPNYIVARVNGDHYVLALRQSGVYDTKGNFGDMVQDAKQVADILNQYAGRNA